MDGGVSRGTRDLTSLSLSLAHGAAMGKVAAGRRLEENGDLRDKKIKVDVGNQGESESAIARIRGELECGGG